jgi:hypothetical protein
MKFLILFVSILAAVVVAMPSGVNFINILCTHFALIFWHQIISNPKHSFVIFDAKILYKKHSSKTLMKMTAADNIFLSRQGGPIQFLSCIIQSVENSTTAGVRIRPYSRETFWHAILR